MENEMPEHLEKENLSACELVNANKDKSKLTSSPPVELEVGRIPAPLNICGVRNIFSQYGELRDVSQLKVEGSGHTEFKCDFVTYSNTREALAAIENRSQRAPLCLKVEEEFENEVENEEKKEEEDKDEDIVPLLVIINDNGDPWEREMMEDEVQPDEEEEEDEVQAEEKEEEEEEEEDWDKVIEERRRMQRVKDGSGREIFFEADFPKFHLGFHTHAHILYVHEGRAYIRIILKYDMKYLEDIMKEESEFLKCIPRVKQVCAYQRNGKFFRVVVDVVRDSGVVHIHGVDDGTRIKVDDWRELRYISAAQMKCRPYGIMVRLARPERSPQTGEVRIKYLGKTKGYPVVELFDVLAELEASSEFSVIDQENNARTNSGALVATITKDLTPVTNNSRTTGLVIGKTQKVMVTHVESPGEVYFVKCREIESFRQFHLEFKRETQSLGWKTDFSPGVGSIVLVNIENFWYRGEVLAMQGPSLLRFYAVDFGFTDVVEMSQVRDIPDHLSSFKTRHHYAVRCSLKGWEEGQPGPTSLEMSEIYEELPFSIVSPVRVKVIHHNQSDGIYIVEVENIRRKFSLL